MPLRVTGLRLPLSTTTDDAIAEALGRARLTQDDLDAVEIVRCSQDRRRRRPVLCFTIDLHLKEAPRGTALGGEGVSWVEAPELPEIPRGEAPLEPPPVIVGTGPAGLFAGLSLARRGFRPVLIERGDRMNHRVRSIRDLNRDGVLDPESNYLFGEGGAGTFSDGKLTSRSKDPRARFVLQEFREKSGIARVMWDYRPHLGSDRVRTVVGRIRQEILSLGGTIRFRCRMTGLDLRGGAVRAVRTSEGEIPTRVCILAPGHSARDLVRELARTGVAIEPKPFQLGVRIEHPQEFVDRAVWGSLAGRADLGPADYRLVARRGEASVYSFCMCPGGEIIPAVSDLGHMNTNGMSWSHRDTGFANSGLVTTLEPSAFGADDPLAGIALQERFEARAAELVDHGLKVPAQRLGDWLSGEVSDSLPASSCETGHVPVDLREVVPPAFDRLLREAMSRFDRQMPGYLHPEALLVGPESRSSSPVRLVRDPETHESTTVPGLYPVGEGAGYAGGIVSAAVDGLRAAHAVESRYHPVGARESGE